MTAKVKKGLTTCTIDELNFPVELRNNPMPSNKEYCKLVIGKINGEDFFLNACSNVYELVKNESIFPRINSILKKHKIAYDVEFTHTNNVRFYANYVITDERLGYKMKGTNDRVQPVLRVQHSYNGLTKYKIVFGYFRLVCSNGLVIAIEAMNKYNLCLTGKHTKAIIGSLVQLDNLLTVFANDAKSIRKELVDKYELLGGRIVTNVQDRVREVMMQNKLGIIENSNFNTIENISQRILDEANDNLFDKQGNRIILGYKGKVNDWLVYNGINQYINDDSLNVAAPEKRQETDSKVFEYMLENA
jgi:hypothetical protein